MDIKICYLNTDLDLISANDLTTLVAAFKAGGASPLHVRVHDNLWYATFEADGPAEPEPDTAEPEPDIAAMLSVVESLPAPLRTVWDGCTLREFNIGYDCGAEPWAYNRGLSADLLGRMKAAGASLRITLYPDRAAVEPPNKSV